MNTKIATYKAEKKSVSISQSVISLKKRFCLQLISWFLVLGSCLFFPMAVQSQQYPVQVNAFMIPPISPRLGDLATTTDNKLQLQIQMTDLMEPSHQVMIRFSLENFNGQVLARSNDFIMGLDPITLSSGTFLNLTNIDLRPLFELENLLGINALQYSRPLPESTYRFCFEVYDFYTKRTLSAKSCYTTRINIYDPPILNLPLKGEKVISQNNFQNILFQWMSVGYAPNTRYTFTLKELWDNERDPISGFLSSRPLWEEETVAPVLFYGPGKTSLMPGKRYAWQVQAKSSSIGLLGSADPNDDNGVYKNGGRSEIFYFDYVENCNVPSLLLAKNIGRGKTEIRWSIIGSRPNGLYQVQYRKRDGNTQWVTQQSYQEVATITNLKDNTEYEYRVGNSCGSLYTTDQTSYNPNQNDPTGNAYAFSPIQYFKTGDKKEQNDNFQCGIIPQIDISNKTLLNTALGRNEVFMAGDFPVTVLESQGTSGTYSGTGFMEVPYLGDTRIKVVFNNIKINADRKLIEGFVETTYDPAEKNIVDLGEIVNDISDLVSNLSDAVDALEDLLSKDKINNQEQFDESWTEHVKTIEKEKQLLFETGNLPANIKDEITEMSGNTFIASTDKTKPPTQKDFPKAKEELAALENILTSIKETEDGLKNLMVILKNLGTDAFIKCKQCEGQKIENLGGFDDSKNDYHKFSYYKKAYICLIASLKEGKKVTILTDNLSLSSDKIVKVTPEIANLVEATKTAFNNKQDLLAIIDINNELVSCDVIYPFSNEVCEGQKKADDETLLNVSKELEKCYYSDYEPKLIAGTLKEIKKNSRSTQDIEFVKGGKIYTLNNNGEVEEIKKPLTDNDIRNGKWTDNAIDVKLRVTQNKEGVFQYQAVGIRSTLVVASGKTAKLKDLASHIESKGNAFFQKYNVIKADLTPAKAGVNLNKDNEVFADGEKIALDNNASYFKISAEGIGLLNTFLQTAVVEKPAYLTSTKNSTIIHAPGLVTGTVESGATVVTDITSLCSTVYDLSTDEKTRTEMYTGLVKLKNAVKDEPSGIIPIFVQMLSGNTNDEWAEIAKNQTDEGRKGHLYSRGVVTSVKSVIVGGVLITKLSELSEKLIENIKNIKKISRSFVENPFDEFKKLKKNIRYRQGEFGYFTETDELGRIDFAETENLQLSITERAKHSPDTPGKLEGDHAGHIFGDRFGGSPELDNLVSQASTVNLSKFKVLENRWAKALKNGEKVDVKIKVIYEGNDLRPSKFQIEYIIGGKYNELEILNKN